MKRSTIVILFIIASLFLFCSLAQALTLDEWFEKVKKDDLVNKGREYAINKDFNNAVECYTKALADNPNNIFAYTLRASSYIKMELYSKAVSDLDKAINIAPNEPCCYWYRANYYRSLKKESEAIADYSKAVKLDPHFLLMRGSYYCFDLGKCDNGLEDFISYIKLFPEDDNGYVSRATAYAKKGEFNKAIVDFTKAIELNPTEGAHYRNRGMIYELYLNELDKALDDYKKACDLGYEQGCEWYKEKISGK